MHSIIFMTEVELCWPPPFVSNYRLVVTTKWPWSIEVGQFLLTKVIIFYSFYVTQRFLQMYIDYCICRRYNWHVFKTQ